MMKITAAMRLIIGEPNIFIFIILILYLNLSNYYKPYNCLMGLSLKERSILIFILDNNNSRVIIFEKINLLASRNSPFRNKKDPYCCPLKRDWSFWFLKVI